MRHLRRSQRGSAFIVSIAVLAGLVAVLASIAASQQTALQAQYGRQDRARARRAAESGIQRAIAELANVAAANPDAANATNVPTAAPGTLNNAVTLQDQWAQLGQNGDERFVLGREHFRLQIIDAASRINVNTAPQEQLERLPLTLEQIESLLDYREQSQFPRGQGAKDEFYNALTEGYNAKLRPLDTVDELLQVRGWTPDILYRPITDVASNTPLPVDANGQTVPLIDLFTVSSYSPQIDPTGQARINVNTGNVQQRLQQAGFSEIAITLITSRNNWAGIGEIAAIPALPEDDRTRVLDYLAVNGQPRVAGLLNINTAGEEVLATVPGITPDVAQAIVQRQGQGFASLGELTTIPGVSAGVLQLAADRLTAISQSFIVRVIGGAGESKVAVEAIVDVADGQPRIRQILEVPYSNVAARWGWNEQTTTDTILRESS